MAGTFSLKHVNDPWFIDKSGALKFLLPVPDNLGGGKVIRDGGQVQRKHPRRRRSQARYWTDGVRTIAKCFPGEVLQTFWYFFPLLTVVQQLRSVFNFVSTKS
jgi:hypothetical protein